MSVEMHLNKLSAEQKSNKIHLKLAAIGEAKWVGIAQNFIRRFFDDEDANESASAICQTHQLKTFNGDPKE